MDAHRYKELGVSSAKTALRGVDNASTAFCRMVASPSDNTYTVLHSDGTGTKALLADLDCYADVLGLAQDAIVMNTDDMACVGVTDGFVISTIINRNPAVVSDGQVRNIIRAIDDVCARFRAMGVDIQSCGGETADVGEMVSSFTLDVSAVSRINAADVIDNGAIRQGDVIVGLSSYGQANYEDAENSGVGSNGLTWLRHDLPLSDAGILQLLKSPTRTYLPIVKDVLKALGHGVHGMVHITGGAHTKTLRAVHGLGVVKDNLFPVPPIFAEVAELPGVCHADLYRVFNMGHRYEVFTAPEDAATVVEVARRHGVEARVVGRVCAGKEMILETPYGTFSYE